MQPSTLAEIVQEKNLAKLPVLDYREENGKAVIQVQLHEAKSTPKDLLYDPEKVVA